MWQPAIRRAKTEQIDESQDQDHLTNITSSFIQCAHLVLPWLTPQELATISLTCKTISQVSKSITLRRSFDASRSIEKHPIPFHSPLCQLCPYAYFLYTPSQLFPSQSPTRQPWGSITLGPRGGDTQTRHCKESLSHRGSLGLGETVFDSLYGASVSRHGRDLEGGRSKWPVLPRGSMGLGEIGLNSVGGGGDSVSRISENLVGGVSATVSCECDCEGCERLGRVGDGSRGLLGAEEMGMGILMECGPTCGCGLGCANRLTQRGISVKLKIVRNVKKGWGLYADQLIRRGQFVCEYAGELLTTEEARRRQQIYDELTSGSQVSPALLVVREHLPSRKACLRINIDATRIGNVARFINHSCDGGNLSTILVRSSGSLLPRLCFFASKDIEEGEELTFSYGEIRVGSKNLQCFCSSTCCFGTLPSEHT